MVLLRGEGLGETILLLVVWRGMHKTIEVLCESSHINCDDGELFG